MLFTIFRIAAAAALMISVLALGPRGDTTICLWYCTILWMCLRVFWINGDEIPASVNWRAERIWNAYFLSACIVLIFGRMAEMAVGLMGMRLAVISCLRRSERDGKPRYLDANYRELDLED